VGGFVSSEGFLRFQGLDEQQQQHEEEATVESELLDFLCNTHAHAPTHSWLPPTICIFVFVPIVIFFSAKESLLVLIVVFQLTHLRRSSSMVC
jgi:hypothetical protein